MREDDESAKAVEEVKSFDWKGANMIATSSFLEAYKCILAACSALDTVVTLAKTVTTGALALIPGVGPLLAGLLSRHLLACQHRGHMGPDQGPSRYRDRRSPLGCQEKELNGI